MSAKQLNRREKNRKSAQKLNAERNSMNETSHNQEDIIGNPFMRPDISPNPQTILASPMIYNFLTGHGTPEVPLGTTIHFSPNVPTDGAIYQLIEPEQRKNDLNECSVSPNLDHASTTQSSDSHTYQENENTSRKQLQVYIYSSNYRNDLESQSDCMVYNLLLPQVTLTSFVHVR